MRLKSLMILHMRRLYSIFRLLRINEKNMDDGSKKLLIIYDFSTQPISIGDILIAQEASLVLREEYNVETVDFAIYFDSKNPSHPDEAFSHVGPDNAFSILGDIVQAVQVNQYLGSVLLFSDRSQLEDYILSNTKKYFIWPSPLQYASREYIYYSVFNELLNKHYNKYNSIPHLHCRSAAQQWAESFIHNVADQKKVVTIQLRKNNKTPARDTDDNSWFKLFEYCEKNHYDVIFIIICARNEINSDIRKYNNIVVAKDYCTNVEQDLALVALSDIHMGASSGPSTMAFFSDKPYCLFKWDGIEHLYKNLIYKDNSYYFYFSNDAQKLIKKNETPELLINEFISLLASSESKDTR